MFRRMVTRMALPAIAGLSLLLVGGPAKADQQGWPVAGSWGTYGGSGGSSSGSYSRFAPRGWNSLYATYPSSSGSYSAPSYAGYQIWFPQPGSYYGFASPPNYFRSSPTEGYYGSTGSEGYYRTPTAQSPGKRPVRVNLLVPSDAKVWFDGSQTNQTGTMRSFESPPMASGREYVYEIQIAWKHDGKDMTQTRQIKVHGGDVINLTLGSPEVAVGP